MSRERSLAHAISDVKYRRRHRPLAALIADVLNPTDSRGVPCEPCYRHPAQARRHLLLDAERTRLKRHHNRIARRVARRQVRQELGEL